MRLIGRIFVGLLAMLGGAVFLGGVLVTIAILSLDGGEALPPKVVLQVDLNKGVTESAPEDFFAELETGDRVVLHDLTRTLDRAAKDERVTAVVARLSGGSMGMATAQEIRDAVANFRKSGKRAVLYSESIGEFGSGTIAYYVASAFSHVWLQPSGDVMLTGFMLESPFLAGTFEELGVQAQFGSRHEYKSATEMFTRKGFTEPSRENLQQLMNSWYGQVVDGIAQGRRIAPEKVRLLVDSAPLQADAALQAGLVDTLGYWDEMEASVTEGGAKMVKLADYLAAVGPELQGGAKVAVIHGIGPVQGGESKFHPMADGAVMGADTVAKGFRQAIEDKEVKAILFRVSSPGGSYIASDTIWREVKRAREAGKPVVVSMGDMAASGGYFVAMPANKVVANPGTITGSIGVFAGKLVLTDFWKKIGVSWDGVGRGENADMWSMNQPFSEAAWAKMDEMLDRIYDDFTTKAAAGRGLDPEQMDQLARGRVWTGADAKQLGLVDELGGMSTALKVLRAEAGLRADQDIDLVRFPEPKSPFEALKDLVSGSGSPIAARLALAQDPRVVRALDRLDPMLRALDATDPAAGALRDPRLQAIR